VHEAGGVRYYDDSKATNVGAVVKSLDGFSGGVILLAGGLEKGGGFTALRPVVAKAVRLVVAYGVARSRIATDLADAAPVKCVQSFSEAVRESVEAAKPGDVVLLSPACASFDQFDDYAARGMAFRRLVGGRSSTAPADAMRAADGCR
jgi:UDP-N-acetylmuramoylalanine--D-glutamate ligase